MKVVVGLGNPGTRYQGTRHNVGFMVVEELAKRWMGGRPQIRFDAEIVEVNVGEARTLLVAPQTYMNASGRSVGRLMDFYKLEHSELAVVCDDLNLPTGQLRWRGQGSHGGQKGLLDIGRHLGGTDFPRLRIGIDRPPGRMDASAWVLGRFRSEERELVEGAILSAADSVELWIREGLSAAMNRYNQRARPAGEGPAA